MKRHRSVVAQSETMPSDRPSDNGGPSPADTAPRASDATETTGATRQAGRLRSFGPQSLRWKLAIAIIGFSTAIIVGLGFFAYQSGRQALISATASDLISAVSEKEQAIGSWLRLTQTNLVALSLSELLRNDLAVLSGELTTSNRAKVLRDKLTLELQGWSGADRPFNSILFIEPKEGEVVFSTIARELNTYKETRDYFAKGQEGPIVVGPYHSVTTGEVVFATAAPVLSENGSLLGVLVGRFNMDEIDRIMQRRRGLNETFDSYLVNTARLFVSQPRQLPDAAVLVRGTFTEVVDQCLAGRSGWAIGNDYRDVETITAYQWLPDLRLCILAKLDKNEAFRPSNVFGWTTLGGGTVALLAAALLAFFVSNWVARPILELLAATREIRDGNLQVSLATDGTDEIARLALGFRDMTESLKARDLKIEEYTRTLEQRVDEELTKNREKDAVVMQQSRLAALGEMIGNIAHQWRQPLNAMTLILGNIKDAQQHGELDDSYLDEQINQGLAIAGGMSATIEDFRNFFRPERQKRLFLPSEAVNNALKLIEAAFKNDDILVDFVVDEDVEVLGFLNEYAQVVLNMLVNARDAIRAKRERDTEKAKTGHLKITLGRSGNSARLVVSDNGGGIPRDLLHKIFDPYFTTRDRGTGIGLYLSKTIIERNMHGRIDVRNTDEGAEFMIDTPLATRREEHDS